MPLQDIETTTAFYLPEAGRLIFAIVGAVASSLRNRPVKPATAVFGEVGLAGEIRGTSQASLRIREAAQMGFTRVIVPEANVAPEDAPAGCELVAVKNVGEALDQLMDW